MPEGSSSDSAEPPPGGEPSVSSRRDSRPISRGRYPAVWVAAGLVLLGASAGIVLIHESDGRPPAPAAFCGLVECSVLHSAAAAAREPSGNPRPVPFPSSPTAPVPTPAPEPTAAAPSPAPVLTPAPAPAVTPTPAASPEPARTPQPVRTPGPGPTWTPPAPRWPWPPPRWPLPPWPSAGGGWSHHSTWWQGQGSHQQPWW